MSETKQEWTSKTPNEDGCYFVRGKIDEKEPELFPVIIYTDKSASRRVVGNSSRHDINTDIYNFLDRCNVPIAQCVCVTG